MVQLVQWVQTRAGRGPIFEDGPGFESSFRLYHGKDGVVPLRRGSEEQQRWEASSESKPNLRFNPLSASAAATISLSSFGPAGPFGFDGFMESFNAKKKANKKKAKKQEREPEKEHKSHAESHVSGWICPFLGRLGTRSCRFVEFGLGYGEGL